jgi:hypothetical protein
VLRSADSSGGKGATQTSRMESFTVTQRCHNHKVAFHSKPCLDRPKDHFLYKIVSRVLRSRRVEVL